MNETLKNHKQYLLTGVSYVVPFIASGGILIATAIAFAPMTPAGPDFSQSPHLKTILDLGAAAFAMSLPILAGYIAYAMAGRPALVAGMVGGYLANSVQAGFLGALIAGLLAGHIVSLAKKIPAHKYIRPIMPIIIIPMLSTLIVGLVMLKVVGVPIADFMVFLRGWLNTMGQGNAIVLGALLGAMIAFDMGGPVNKTAFFFGVAMLKDNPTVMGACAAAICTPPLGLGLATLIGKRWTQEERESGLAALGMGMIGITEGAIPFAASDPLRVIPSIMFGSMVASSVAMLGKVKDHAPHGGLIVLPVIDERLTYIIAIALGVVTTAVTINLVKKFTEKPALAAQQKS